jgi:hypothetical protein
MIYNTFIMKKFILIILLIKFISISSHAEDIKNFEIEGMSIGDNLLNYFTKNQLEEFVNHSSTFHYPDGKTKIVRTHSKEPLRQSIKKSSTYDFAGVSFKDPGWIKRKDSDERDYKIIGIQGYISFEEVNDCNKERLKIEKDIENVLNIKPKRETKKHAYDKTSQSFTSWFNFSTNDSISINCTDWQKKFNWNPNLKVSIISAELKKILKKNY